MNEEIKRARELAKNMEPLVRIGKNGLTEGIVGEVAKLLKKKKVIKVKFLHAFVEENDRKEAAAELAAKTNSIMVHQVGGIVVLMRREK
jgi:RNA-binding protein